MQYIKYIIKIILVLFLGIWIYFVALPSYSYVRYSPVEGDIVFQSLPKMDLVVAIEGVTHSPYSHVGLAIQKENNWYVREAIGGVLDTPLHQWILRGRQGGLDVYRLKKEYQKDIPQLLKETEKYMGLPYDVKYDMDDEKIYCSELIYKAYRDATGKKMGKLVALGNMN